MWIWYVSQSSGGDLAKIARKAHRRGIETIYIKSSDGSSAWSQFSRALVSYLHARNLRVCGWQFVYGIHPGAEARRGAAAVRKGADCLVIDAESTYEGRYGAADAYVDKLRHRIGAGFPTALTSFPYVDYHPGLPYSVFLGPGGARYNLPQLYWHTIGVTVRQGYEHTFRVNRVYRRGIYPLGQTYDHPPIRQLRRFRRMANSYDFRGVSWWSWQETNKREWRALGRDVKGRVSGAGRAGDGYPVLSKGSSGDLVVWAQEHLQGRRPIGAGDRLLRRHHPARGEALPACRGPLRQRPNRAQNVASAARRDAADGRLVQQELASQREAPGRPGRTALGLAAGAALRDPDSAGAVEPERQPAWRARPSSLARFGPAGGRIWW